MIDLWVVFLTVVAVELTLGKWFDETNRRDDIFLATKFGALDPEGKFGGGKQCSEPRYIKYALERSLARLRTSYIDLYYQHRVDPAVPIESIRRFRLRVVGATPADGVA